MTILGLILLVLIAFSISYSLFAAYCTFVFFRAREGSEEHSIPEMPPVSIIKPVSGLEDGYWENFVSFCGQNYPRYEILFAVSQQNDPVIPLLEDLKRLFPDQEIGWTVVKGNRGPNYKVGNLIGAVHAAQFDILVLSDCDIRVGPTYLREVVSPLLKEQTGMVTCLYRNRNIHNIFDVFQALTVQSDFIPNVLFDRRVEGLAYAFGATICTSKRVLSRFGGLESFLDYLADDYQLGNRVRKEGYEIGLSRYLADHVPSTESFKGYFRHQLRAAITHKVCRPMGYFTSVITQSVSMSALLLMVGGFSPAAAALLLSVCGVRLAIAAYLNRAVFRNEELNAYIWLIPLSDLLNTFFWFLSLFLNVVYWRHRRFRVMRGGKMVELA
jgi:ceramide glucosyltransferase